MLRLQQLCLGLDGLAPASFFPLFVSLSITHQHNNLCTNRTIKAKPRLISISMFTSLFFPFSQIFWACLIAYEVLQMKIQEHAPCSGCPLARLYGSADQHWHFAVINYRTAHKITNRTLNSLLEIKLFTYVYILLLMFTMVNCHFHVR